MLAGIPPLYLVLAGLIGLLVGLLAASIFSSKDTSRVKGKLPPADMLKEGYADEIRLWYSPAGKKIITELDGEYYRAHNTLSREQKKRVAQLFELWKKWNSEEKPGVQSKEENIVFPLPSAAAVQEETSPFTAELLEEDLVLSLKQGLDKEEISNDFKDFPEDEIKAEDPSYQPYQSIIVENQINDDEEDFLANLARSVETTKPQIEEAPVKKRDLSIAEQVSRILAQLLEGSELKEKGITLIENQSNGVDVWVGLERFSGIEEVPYPEVKQLIRQAVQLWEKESGI